MYPLINGMGRFHKDSPNFLLVLGVIKNLKLAYMSQDKTSLNEVNAFKKTP